MQCLAKTYHTRFCNSFFSCFPRLETFEPCLYLNGSFLNLRVIEVNINFFLYLGLNNTAQGLYKMYNKVHLTFYNIRVHNRKHNFQMSL